VNAAQIISALVLGFLLGAIVGFSASVVLGCEPQEPSPADEDDDWFHLSYD
jgi:hypothetical protein